MIDDRALARALTDAVLATPGIVAVFPVKPILHAASEGLANALDLDEPEVLVDVDRSDSLLTVTAHVATTSDCSTPEVLGRAAEALRAVAEREGVEPAGRSDAGVEPAGVEALDIGHAATEPAGVERAGTVAAAATIAPADSIVVFVKARLIADPEV